MSTPKHLVDGKYTIRDLVDLKKLRAIFQHFTDTMGFTIGFLSIPDMEILVATGWRDVCTKFHRRCPKAAENCRKSNAHLVRQMTKPGKVVIERCANGLVDCAMPIYIKGKCVAILATGQVLLAPPDLSRFRKQAKTFGCNEKKYMTALGEVPVIAEKRLRQVTGFLKELAMLVAELGYAGLKEKEKSEQLARDIDQRRITEKELRETAAQLKLLQNAATDGVVLADIRTGKIVKASESACHMFGYSAEEFRRKKFADLHPPDKIKKVAAIFRSMTQKEKTFAANIPCRKKDGSFFVADIAARPMLFGGKRCLAGFFRDVTERELAVGKERDASRRLQAIFDSTFQFIALLLPDGEVLEVNQSALKFAGLTPRHVRRKYFWDCHWWTISKEARRDVKKAVVRAARGRFVRYPVEVLGKKGNTLSIDFSLTPIRDEKGRVTLLVAEGRDISERQRTEALLKQREAYLMSIIDNQSGMVWLKDKESRLLAVNRIYAKMAGRKKTEQVVGKTDLDFWPPELADKYRADDRKVMNNREHVTVEELISEKGIARWHETFKAPVFDRAGKVIGTTGYARDITERKRLDNELAVQRVFSSALLENMSSAVVACNERGELVLFNREARRWHGLDPRNIPPSQWARHYNLYMEDGVTPMDIRTVPLARAFRGETVRDVGMVIAAKGRPQRYVIAQAAPVREKDGRVLGAVAVMHDMTERKLAAEAIRKSKIQYQELVENAKDGIFSLDDKGFFVLTNPEFRDMLGYSQKELKKLNVLDTYPEGARSQGIERLKLLKLGETLRFERPMKRKDGSLIFVDVVGWKNDEGLVQSFVRNVTDRKRAEDALRESARSLKEVQTIAGLGNYTLDIRSGLWQSSPVLDEIFGIGPKYKRTEKGWLALVHPDWRESLGDYFRNEVIGKRGRFDREYKILRQRDKEERWVHGLGELKLDAEGRPVAMIGTILDITDRKNAEIAIREHRRQLLQIIDAVPHMIFAKDKNGRILLANRAVGAMYGKEPQELIGTCRRDIHPVAEEVAAYLKVDREVLATGQPRVVPDEVFTDIYGRRHILQTVKIPFRMVGIRETCILGVSVDVTEQKQVEEFRNDIVRTVSHELRTPLSIEKEGISLLVDEMVGPVNAEQREILQTVMRSIDRLARMISSLLDISSIETGRIKLLAKPTDLTELVKDVAFEFKKRAAEKGIELAAKFPEEGIRALADPDKITQVLTNLVDNALKFTAKGSIEVSVTSLKDEAECTVRDTGIGISAGNIGKLFEKFQQFSRTAGPGEKGFGLGLSIAKGIIELHGGRIWARSEEGRGTSVTFVLPLAEKKEI